MFKKSLFWSLGIGCAAAVLSGGFAFAAGENEGKEFQMPKNPVMVMETNQGTIKMKLYPEIAPLACENMIRLAGKGYYDGIIFHRVIKGFMIQGGDPAGTGGGGQSIWGDSFADEFSEKAKFDRPGLLAMANAGPGTNGSQFFITVAPTAWLNGRHTIFGEVISGYDVVQKIENCATGEMDRPVTEQKIIKMRLEKGKIPAAGVKTEVKAKEEKSGGWRSIFHRKKQ